jgi:hypothetical protein
MANKHETGEAYATCVPVAAVLPTSTDRATSDQPRRTEESTPVYIVKSVAIINTSRAPALSLDRKPASPFTLALSLSRLVDLAAAKYTKQLKNSKRATPIRADRAQLELFELHSVH